MNIRKATKNKRIYYELYDGQKFVRHIGNQAAYEKYKRDVSKGNIATWYSDDYIEEIKRKKVMEPAI